MFCAISINTNKTDLLESVLKNDPIEVIMPKFYATKAEDLSEDITTTIALHAIKNYQTQLFHFFSEHSLSTYNRHIAIDLALANHGPEEKDLSQVISVLLEKGFTYFANPQEVLDLAESKGLDELAHRIEADTTLRAVLEIIEDPDRLDKTRYIKQLLPLDSFCDGHYEEAAKAAINMNLFSLASWLCEHIEDEIIYKETKQRIDPDVILERVLSIIENPNTIGPMRESQKISPVGVLKDRHYLEAAEAALERKLPTLAAWLRSHIENDHVSTRVDEMIKHSLITRHSSSSPSTVSTYSRSSPASSASEGAAAGQPSPTP